MEPVSGPSIFADFLAAHGEGIHHMAYDCHDAAFSAIIVDTNGEVLATGVNRVGEDCDPTAHAEAMAIRHSGARRGAPDLGDTVLIASGEPCAMCCVTALFAGITQVIFAADRDEAARFGFDYRASYRWLAGDGDALPLALHKHATRRAVEPFEHWRDRQSRR